MLCTEGSGRVCTAIYSSSEAGGDAPRATDSKRLVSWPAVEAETVEFGLLTAAASTTEGSAAGCGVDEGDIATCVIESD